MQESFINVGRDAVDNGVRPNGFNRFDRVAVERVELPALLRDGADARAAVPPRQATLRGSVCLVLCEDGLHGRYRVVRILDQVCAEEGKFLGLL